MKNGLDPVVLRTRISRTWWLPVIFLLTVAVTIKADIYGDYNYTINPNGTVRIDGYTGSGGAVTIPSEITGRAVVGIGRVAFAGSSNLTSVTIPNSVTYLEDLVFNDCTSLGSVTIGSGLTDIGYGVFNYCTNLTALTVDALNSSYSSLDGVLFNKNQTTLVQCPAGKTGSYAIPGTVTNIGDYAFDSCSGLTGITIPNGVISIGKQAFYACTGLAGVTIPDSVTSIGIDAFNYCTSLAIVTIGNGVTSIGNNAFNYCSSLTGVTIPDSVTNIGERAFARCASLPAITVDAGNSSYSSLDGVLFNKNQTILVQCPAGKAGSYTIPGTVTNIGGDAFAPYPSEGLGGFGWCTRLTGITIPDSVTSIGKSAFLYCTGLTSITIPNSVVSLGYCAFENCTGLTGVTLGNGLTSITYWTFSGCSGLAGITIPNSIVTIESQAFQSCTGLTSITIPNSVTNIGMAAFVGCTHLVSVTLGNGLTRIGEFAFSSCSNLTGAYFWGNAPTLDSNDVFDGDNNATVYYLAGSTGWDTTFGGRPTALWNPLPRPIITANGLTGAVTVNYPNPMSIRVEMNAGNYAGVPVDWWVIALAGTTWCYLNSALQWTLYDGNIAYCHPMYQGGLFNLPATTVLNMAGLPVGSYTFWFAIDYPMDGILNLDKPMVVNSVNVVVR